MSNFSGYGGSLVATNYGGFFGPLGGYTFKEAQIFDENSQSFLIDETTGLPITLE